MAAKKFRASSGDVATSTSLKTVAQLRASANNPLEVTGFRISFRGSDPAAAPIRVRILRQTTDGTGASMTPVLDPENAAHTLQLTGAKNFTGEPTAGEVLWEGNFHPQGGGIDRDLPADDFITVKGGDRLGMDVLAGADVTCNAGFNGRE